MKSALVKPQNARMSDSECGQWGWTRADFMYSWLKSQMQCTCYSERYYVWQWEQIFEHIIAKQRAPCNCCIVYNIL